MIIQTCPSWYQISAVGEALLRISLGYTPKDRYINSELTYRRVLKLTFFTMIQDLSATPDNSSFRDTIINRIAVFRTNSDLFINSDFQVVVEKFISNFLAINSNKQFIALGEVATDLLINRIYEIASSQRQDINLNEYIEAVINFNTYLVELNFQNDAAISEWLRFNNTYPNENNIVGGISSNLKREIFILNQIANSESVVNVMSIPIAFSVFKKIDLNDNTIKNNSIRIYQLLIKTQEAYNKQNFFQIISPKLSAELFLGLSVCSADTKSYLVTEFPVLSQYSLSIMKNRLEDGSKSYSDLSITTIAQILFHGDSECESSIPNLRKYLFTDDERARLNEKYLTKFLPNLPGEKEAKSENKDTSKKPYGLSNYATNKIEIEIAIATLLSPSFLLLPNDMIWEHCRSFSNLFCLPEYAKTPLVGEIFSNILSSGFKDLQEVMLSFLFKYGIKPSLVEDTDVFTDIPIISTLKDFCDQGEINKHSSAVSELLNLSNNKYRPYTAKLLINLLNLVPEALRKLTLYNPAMETYKYTDKSGAVREVKYFYDQSLSAGFFNCDSLGELRDLFTQLKPYFNTPNLKLLLEDSLLVELIRQNQTSETVVNEFFPDGGITIQHMINFYYQRIFVNVYYTDQDYSYPNKIDHFFKSNFPPKIHLEQAVADVMFNHFEKSPINLNQKSYVSNAPGNSAIDYNGGIFQILAMYYLTSDERYFKLLQENIILDNQISFDYFKVAPTAVGTLNTNAEGQSFSSLLTTEGLVLILIPERIKYWLKKHPTATSEDRKKLAFLIKTAEYFLENFTNKLRNDHISQEFISTVKDGLSKFITSRI